MTKRLNRFDWVGSVLGQSPGQKGSRGQLCQKKELFFTAWKSPGEFQQVWNAL